MIPDPNKVYQTTEVVVMPKPWNVLARVEVREFEGETKTYLVFPRGNSRAFDYPTTRFIHLMRERGLQIIIEVHGVEVTLEQFEKTGAWSARSSQTVQSPQGRYNAVADLKRLEYELQQLDPNDPQFYAKAQQVQHKRAMLGTAEIRVTAEQEALKKSDEELKELIPLMLSGLSDDQLAVMTIDDLEKLKIPKNTPTWSALMDKRALAQKHLKEKTHEQSAVAVTNQTQTVVDRSSPTHEGVFEGRDGSASPDRAKHLLVKPTEGS